MAPDSSPQATVVDSPNFIRILSTSKGSDGPAMASATKLVSAESGGTVMCGHITLSFPAHALDTDTYISITPSADGTLGAELTPHGIQFNRPVTMSMDLTGTSAEGEAQTGNTVWWNEQLQRYELVEPAPSTNASKLDSYLEHFSGYRGVVGG